MFTDRTQIDKRPFFADEIEALQPEIKKVQEKMNQLGGLGVVKQLNKAGEA